MKRKSFARCNAARHSAAVESSTAYSSILNWYQERLREHGDSHLGVGWPDQGKVEVMYRVMLGITDPLASGALLDFGCGPARGRRRDGGLRHRRALVVQERLVQRDAPGLPLREGLGPGELFPPGRDNRHDERHVFSELSRGGACVRGPSESE